MTAMKYKAVLWDMDGVLIDSERHWDSLGDLFLEDVVTDWDAFDKTRLVGRSLRDIYNLFQDEYGIAITFEEYVEEYNKLAKFIYQNKAELLPHAISTLTEIQNAGTTQGLVSSSSHMWIEYALKRFPLRQFFDVIVSSDDVDGVGKPDPAIYTFACNQIGVPPDQAIVVEDSTPGITAAREAGSTVIGFDHQDNIQDLAGADIFISDLEEIPEILFSAG